MYNCFVGKMDKSAVRGGLVQALGIVAYCSMVGLFFWKGDEIFGKMSNYFGPVAFLLLLSVSILICALIVFYKPYILFFDNKSVQLTLFSQQPFGFSLSFFSFYFSISCYVNFPPGFRIDL